MIPVRKQIEFQMVVGGEFPQTFEYLGMLKQWGTKLVCQKKCCLLQWWKDHLQWETRGFDQKT